MGDAQKPYCEFCNKIPDERVHQISVYGKLVWLHLWCIYGYKKFYEPTVTSLAQKNVTHS